MPDVQSVNRALAVIAVLAVTLAITLALSGCISSVTPLISPQNADYPFQRITFIARGDEDQGKDAVEITLFRQGDVYVELNKDSAEHYLFKRVAEDLYIGQMSETDDEGELQLLYGVVQIQAKTGMNILSSMCDEVPEDALKATGIVKAKGEHFDECTAASLDQLKTLAGLLVDMDVERQAYRIVELVK